MKVNSQIRNLKRNLIIEVAPQSYKPDNNIFIEKWDYVINSIRDILQQKGTNICFQDLYLSVGDLLLYDPPKDKVKLVDDLFYNHAVESSQKLLQIISFNSEIFFKDFNEFYSKTISTFNLIRKILIKFEKKFYSSEYHQKNICNIFMEHLKNLLKNGFVENFIEKILQKISQHRQTLYDTNNDSMSINNLSEINNSISFLWQTGLYKELFNDKFLQTSSSYYANLAQSIFDTKSIYEYINFVEKVIENETTIITTYLNEFSHKKMISNIESNLISEKRGGILAKLFKPLDNLSQSLSHNLTDIEYLKKVYLMFKRVKLEEEFKKTYIDYINQVGAKIYTEYSKNYINFYESWLELKRTVDVTVRDAYNNDERFKAAAKDGFTKSLNLRPNLVADNFSRFINHILTEPDRDEKYLTDKIDEFIMIFRYLDEKDMFENFYIKKLCLRLLYNLSNSKKCENYLIERFRNECGSVFVTKSEEMLSDISTSIEFTLSSGLSSHSNINCNFYVLSSNSWPVSKVVSGNMPESIMQLHRNFFTFYKNKQAGRALDWHLPYCTAIIDYHINGKIIQLETNGVQAAILSQFNKKDASITLTNLVKLTGIEKDELLRGINSLICSTNNSNNILKNEKEGYQINKSFLPTKSHILINDNLRKEETSAEEIKEVEERNWEDRKYVIDALIMKTLKAKKAMKQAELIQSVLVLAKFPCEISTFNGRLNSLLENGFVVQDENDPELVRYC